MLIVQEVHVLICTFSFTENISAHTPETSQAPNASAAFFGNSKVESDSFDRFYSLTSNHI
jgi:hypothetical protein